MLVRLPSAAPRSFLAANAAFVEALIAEHLGYATALALVATTVLLADALVISLGSERKGFDLHAP